MILGLPETLLTAMRMAPADFIRSTTGASLTPFTPLLACKQINFKMKILKILPSEMMLYRNQHLLF
jgi:hypothetical protein